MIKQLLIGCMIVSSLMGEVIQPFLMIESGGNVIDIIVQEEKIIAGTDEGTVEVYDLYSGRTERVIRFPKISNFFDETVGAKIYSVDKIKREDRYLVVLQSETSYRHLFLVDHGVQEKIISEKDQFMIKKAKFVDRNRVLLGLMTNEVLLYDIHFKKELYRFQISESQFSDFELNEEHTRFASASESGQIAIVDVERGDVIARLEGGNVDNVYKVSFKGNTVLTAGQDRRGIVYYLQSNKFDRYDANFLIYACALSPSAEQGALAFTEENDIKIFDLKIQKEKYTLRGQKSTLNSIVFVDEKLLVSGSDDKFIMIWRLP